jgi:MoxR-like ATPase
LFQHHTGAIRLETEQERANRPVVVITSNSERDLPEAFLRRCVFYHLELPPFDDEDRGTAPVTIRDIVLRRLGQRFAARGDLLDQALSLFRYLRQYGKGELKRLPSLAELLNWLDYLGRQPTKPGIALRDQPDFRESARNTLFKSRDDQYRRSGQSKADGLIDRWVAHIEAQR